ncbi:unnamed protein product, partial [Heterosigma akashiwo]
MNGPNAKGLNRMKLVLRKHNKQYEDRIAAFRENPGGAEGEGGSASSSSSSSGSDSDSSSSGSSSGSDSGSDSDSDSGSESDASEKKKKKPASKPKKDLADLDSDEWPSDAESDSDSSDGEEAELKASSLGEKRCRRGPKKKEKGRGRTREAGAAARPGRRRFSAKEAAKAKELALDANLTAADLEQKVLEAAAARGRSKTDAKALLKRLGALAYLARRFGPRKELPVLFQLVSVQLDAVRTLDDYLELPVWKSCWSYLSRALGVLEAHPKLTLGAISEEDLADLVLAAANRKAGRENPAAAVSEKERAAE